MGIWNRIFTGAAIALGFRSLENPSVPLSAGADWLYDAFGAMRAGSGMRVSRETAMTYDAFWRGVSLISRDIGKIPIVTQKRKNMAWEVDSEHPANWLLNKQPNPEMTPFIFRQVLMYHVLALGNAYAYIERDKATGEPVELWPLMPHETWPERKGGQLFYVTQIGERQETLFPDNVLHIKGLGYDGLAGYSVISKARESLGLAMAQTRYAAIFFRNNAQPSIVLKHPGQLSDQGLKHLKDSWTGTQGGIDNAHKPKVVEEGMEVQQLSINARDAQLIETRQFEIRAAANWLNLPPHKLGDNSRLAYNSLEQENQAYLDDALEPWFINIEQESEKKLLTEKQRRKDSHRIQFNRRRLIHANLEARSKYWVDMVNNGLACPDMAADEEGWNPLPNGIGEKYRMPLNIAILGEDGKPINTEPDGDEAKPTKQDGKDPGQDKIDADPNREANKELLKATIARSVKWISRLARDASKKPGKFNDWLDQLDESYVSGVRDNINPVISHIRTTEKRNPEWGDKAAEIIIERAKNSFNDLSGRLKTTEFESRIAEFLYEFERNEPENVTKLLLTPQK